MTVIQSFHYPDQTLMPLSNFYYYPMIIDGYEWKTVEHYYQASKSAAPEGYHEIRDAVTAGAAKRMGRSVALRADWEAVKLGVMRTALEAKFVSGQPLGQWLLDTGDALLVEGNDWHDKFWGVCLCERCGKVGQNWLGVMLHNRRAELRGGM